MSDHQNEILLRCREDGTWEEYKEPYMTIECATEEDFRYLEAAVEHYRDHLSQNEPLAWNELPALHGEPVWIQESTGNQTGWYIVDALERQFVGTMHTIGFCRNGRDVKVYRRKP